MFKKITNLLKSKKDCSTDVTDVTKEQVIQNLSNQEELSTHAKGIMVLGMGCSKCKELSQVAKQAISTLTLDEEVKHVTDIALISAYGVMATPALVIDGEVVSVGKLLSEEQVIELIQNKR